MWCVIMVGLDDTLLVELEVGLEYVLVELVGLRGGVAHVLVILLIIVIVAAVHEVALGDGAPAGGVDGDAGHEVH